MWIFRKLRGEVPGGIINDAKTEKHTRDEDVAAEILNRLWNKWREDKLLQKVPMSPRAIMLARSEEIRLPDITLSEELQKMTGVSVSQVNIEIIRERKDDGYGEIKLKSGEQLLLEITTNIGGKSLTRKDLLPAYLKLMQELEGLYLSK